jgi:predicted nuclease of predicted toxin-antitoxin system
MLIAWLADECVEAALVGRLREAGHDVIYIVEHAPGSTDAEVIALADKEHRILLTEDKDFGDLVFRQRMPVPGLVLLRIEPEQHVLKWQRLDAAINRFVDSFLGRYTVIEEARFRRRALNG